MLCLAEMGGRWSPRAKGPFEIPPSPASTHIVELCKVTSAEGSSAKAELPELAEGLASRALAVGSQPPGVSVGEGKD